MTGPSPKVPVGVVPSPSRWCADSPLRPTRARHGPRTRLPHSRTTSVAVVERAAGAVTWIRCGQPCSASARARVSMRVLCRVMAALPPFHVAVAPVTAAELGASWHQGCPVGPVQLRTLHVSFVGFDGRAHRGAIVVNRSVTGEVTTVFRRLYAARFPIRRMEPIAKYGGSDPRSMAADNTSGFNCRYAVPAGQKRWSVHAYGEAIDVDTLENPHLHRREAMP